MTIPSRLRILHVLPTLRVGGAEQMASHLMVELSKSHEVAAAGLYPESQTPVEHRLHNANIRTWHLGKRPGFDARMYASLARVTKEFQPHVVHTHLHVLRYVFPVLTWQGTPRAVHTLHNVADRESDLFGRMLQRVGFRKGVAPVTISRDGALSFEQTYGYPCRAVIPNSIPVEQYRGNPSEREAWRKQEGFAPGAVLFICVGRLEPQKDPLLLIKAFAALGDPRAHLVLLGDGGLRAQVIGSIKAEGLSQRVHLMGKRNDIPQCLAASDVFVLASRWEGNPLSVMEAMAAGLPVISTSVGGVPELLECGKQGILVDAGDRARLTAAMRRMIDAPEQRERMGEAARERAVAEFDVKRMAEGYCNLYRQILEETTRRKHTARGNGVLARP